MTQAVFTVHTMRPDDIGAVEIVFTTEREARAYAADRSKDWRVLAASITRFTIGELVPRQGRLVRKSADPGFRWVRRRTGLVPGVLGRFAGAASGKLGRRVTWRTFLAGALGTRHPIAWFVDGQQQPQRAPRPGSFYSTDGSYRGPSHAARFS
jgi:hypothetical protein